MNIRDALKEINKKQLELAKANASLLIALKLAKLETSDEANSEKPGRYLSKDQMMELREMIQLHQMVCDKMGSEGHQLWHGTVGAQNELPDPSMNGNLVTATASYRDCEDCLSGVRPHTTVIRPINPRVN